MLRAEKGYPIIGQDTDGTVTPQDLGMEWILSKAKPDFMGKRSFSRADTARPDRKQLVGLLPLDPDALLPEGAQLVDEPGGRAMVGHVDLELPQRRARPDVRARARAGRPRADGRSRPCTARLAADRGRDRADVPLRPGGARRDGRPE